MKEIVRIGLFDIDQNFQRDFNFDGHDFRIKSYGTNGDIYLLKELVQKFDGECDIICLSNLPNRIKVQGQIYAHPLVEEIKSSTRYTPVIDGQALRDIYFPWSIRRISELAPDVLKNKKVGFPAGLVQYNFLDEIYECTDRLVFADPYFILGLPKLLRTKKSLESFVKLSFPLIKKSLKKRLVTRDFSLDKIKKNVLLKDFADCDVYFCNQTQFDYIHLDNLVGKTLVTDFITKKEKERLYNIGVSKIIRCFPSIAGLPFYGFTILEAIFRLIHNTPNQLSSVDIFSLIEKYKLTPSFLDSELESKPEEIRKFGFVIHPLSKDYLLKVPPLNKFNTKPVAQFAEKLAPYFPGVKYGFVKGIKSEATGVRAECDMYAVFETPKMMLKKDKNHMYNKLVKLAYKAEENDNRIMGLGAYTKIVGDAGVTVNKRSPIPVTTGNSLSCAATLWAADFAINKMDLIPKKDDTYQGTLMVVGATGSIGKVSAKILSRTWKKVIVVAPREYKLIDLTEELKELSPSCEVSYTTNPSDHLSECDLIITTTSAQGKRIIDIDKVKPGCVICDVSRPFDIPKEDAISRPDVLVIASGEVDLPGDVKVNRDIGLHGSTVYACLAETALLTLEGRYEAFSISRNLEFEKVIEIDRMARKHGVRLSAIMGHDQEITLEEIDLCKQHALRRST